MRAGLPRVIAAAACLALAGAGCGLGGDGAEGAGRAASNPGESAGQGTVRASSAPLPDRLGIGRPATASEIARIDIDVMPDGTGLPGGGATGREGAAVFAGKCAACHGPSGEGTDLAGALVGREPGDAFDFASSIAAERRKTVGNYWPYATTLFDYVRRAMPFDQPGSLSDEEVYGAVAWVLWKNDIIAGGDVVDSTSLPSIEMPARGHFVPDDRETSTRVR